MPPGPSDDRIWWTGPWWGRSNGGPAGARAEFVALVRGPDDPERSDRGEAGDPRRPDLSVQGGQPAAWRSAIRELMDDGRPRTFNHIGVELVDRTADVLHTNAAERALWGLVDDGHLAHTREAPVRFAPVTSLAIGRVVWRGGPPSDDRTGRV